MGVRGNLARKIFIGKTILKQLQLEQTGTGRGMELMELMGTLRMGRFFFSNSTYVSLSYLTLTSSRLS